MENGKQKVCIQVFIQVLGTWTLVDYIQQRAGGWSVALLEEIQQDLFYKIYLD